MSHRGNMKQNVCLRISRRAKDMDTPHKQTHRRKRLQTQADVYTLSLKEQCLLIRFRRKQKAFQPNDLVMITLENVPDTCQHRYIIHTECSLPKKLWGRGYVSTPKLFFKGFLIPSCNFLLRGEGSSWKLKQLKLCSLQRRIEEQQLKQV